MNIQDALESQYLAALEMVRQAVEKSPDDLWDNRAHQNVFSAVVAHALFYLHFYLSASPGQFEPWEKHREGINQMAPEGEPYSKVELLEYIAFLRPKIGPMIKALALDAPSGFDWLPFSRLELHIYNIRHLQQHTGELFERLAPTGAEIHWVGNGA